MSWFVDMETVKDMMKELPFNSLSLKEIRDPYLAANYNEYVSSAFNGTSYVIMVFCEHKENHNKNWFHIKVYSPKWGIDQSFKVEDFESGDHNKLRGLMKKVLLY